MAESFQKSSMQQTKQEIRREAMRRRDSIPVPLRHEYSELIAKRLLDSPQYQRAGMLFLYISYRSEVETEAILEAALTDGKEVYAPRVMAEGKMEFYRITSPAELIPSPMGIPEPQPDPARLFPYARHEREGEAQDVLVVMPGTAFDRQRNRIGYAGGYYDRFLLRFPKRVTAALAYCEQLVEEIPAEAHDIRPDVIVTPEGMVGRSATDR
ncbi:MAG: 5-formyltetrahydrofolate cyclo-ligase [Eubacteriales bacterium]|nr:5-formyltetrahydrofolate cyclo-ligase [Eubacteriales bacterium]